MVLTWAVLVVAMQTEVVDAGQSVEVMEQPADAGMPAATVSPVAAVAKPEVQMAATRLKNAVGVGFFGATQRSESSGQSTGGSVTVSTPLVGVRWWTPLALGPHGRLGLEVAGGVSLFSSEVEAAAGLTVETQKGATRQGFAFHAAVPLALTSTEHVIISVAPEFRHVFSEFIAPSPTPLVETAPARRPGTSTSDLALRGGVELFFGFIGAPNLSLELTARLILRWVEFRSVGFNNSLSLARTFAVTSSISDDPFAVIVSSIAAKYYF